MSASPDRPIQFDREKLKALVLYAIGKCDPAQLGAVKLHKILYYADMMRFAESGVPLTGARYVKRQHGPTCEPMLSLLRDLERTRTIKVRNVDYFGYDKKEYLAVETPETARFTPHERALIDEVIDFVCNRNTAKTISDFSHSRPWELTEFGETIPYASAFLLYPSEVSPESMEWAREEATKIEAARSKKDPVDALPFGNLRSRL